MSSWWDYITFSFHWIAFYSITDYLSPCSQLAHPVMFLAYGLMHVELLTQWGQVDGLMQIRRNSNALAMELRLSCINPSRWCKYASVNLAIIQIQSIRWIDNGLLWTLGKNFRISVKHENFHTENRFEKESHQQNGSHFAELMQTYHW